MPTTPISKGQITIHRRIRNALSLKPGSLLDFALTGNGDVAILEVA